MIGTRALNFGTDFGANCGLLEPSGQPPSRARACNWDLALPSEPPPAPHPPSSDRRTPLLPSGSGHATEPGELGARSPRGTFPDGAPLAPRPPPPAAMRRGRAAGPRGGCPGGAAPGERALAAPPGTSSPAGETGGKGEGARPPAPLIPPCWEGSLESS